MHPFQKHREDKAGHARVKHILKADGGTVGPTPENLRNKQWTDRVSGRAGAGERYDTSFVGTKKEN